MEGKVSEDCKECLLDHLETTLKMNWDQPDEKITELLSKIDVMDWKENDNFEEFLLKYDFPQHADQKREERFRKALKEVKELADSNVDYNWDLMLRLQRILLGHSVEFRGASAFAKRGRERYSYWEGLPDIWIKKIEKDANSATHPIVKATRTYLDICYFHPFPDGNGRSSALWLVFILRKHRIPFPKDFHEFFVWNSLPILCGNEERYWRTVALLAQLILKNGP